MTQIADGMPSTPMTNSRTERPREIRAMNDPTNGEKAQHQHQMNTVHMPFQLSFHESRGAIVEPASAQVPIHHIDQRY